MLGVGVEVMDEVVVVVVAAVFQGLVPLWLFGAVVVLIGMGVAVGIGVVAGRGRRREAGHFEAGHCCCW